MSKDRIYFNQSPQPTIGVEAELFTVSNKDYTDIVRNSIIELEKGIAVEC